MPDYNALHGQEGQEVIGEMPSYKVSALNLLDIPFQLYRVVEEKMQAEGISPGFPTEPGELTKAYLAGALDDPLLKAAGEFSARSEKITMELELMKKPDSDPDGERELQALRKLCKKERMENLTMLGYRALALKYIVAQNVDQIVETSTEEEGGPLLIAFGKKLTYDLVKDPSLTRELADELTGEQYWDIKSAELLEAATEEGTLWAQAIAGAKRRREDPGSVPVTLERIISAFDDTRKGIEEQREARQEADQRILNILKTAQFPGEAVYTKDQITNTLMLRSSPATKIKAKQQPRPDVKISLGELPQGVSISRNFTEWDDDVFRAINTLWYDGTQTFTADMIYRAMTGNPAAKASEETQQKIFESWIRFTSTWMELNTAGVGKAYGFMEVKRTSHVIEGGTDLITMTNQHGTTSVRYYTVSKEPDLVWYANQLNQVARFPIQYLNVPINKNEDVIHVRNLLLDRIYSIPRQSNTILFEYLFSYLDKEQPPLSKTARERKVKTLRGHVKTMLDFWSMSDGPISGWEEVKKGRSIIGVKVYPRKKAIEASAAGK